jgi:signal transduction histidine kinase
MKTIAQTLIRNLLIISFFSFSTIIASASYGIYTLWDAIQIHQQQVSPKQRFAADILDVSVHIRIQVQEWKNLLLRSTDQTSLDDQWKKVVTQEKYTQDKLIHFIKQNQNSAILKALLDVQSHHRELSDKYKLAMLQFAQDGYNPTYTDSQIKGIDRSLIALIDTLSDQSTLEALTIQKQADQIAENNLFISIVGLILGVLISSISFFIILKTKILQPTERAFADLETATELLIQSERMAGLSQLVAGIAHEINTPVGITLTCSSSLQETCKKIQSQIQNGSIKKQELNNFLEQMIEGCDLIVSNAFRSSNLIKSFKQIAADQSGEQRREFLFNQFLDDVLISLKPEFKHTHLQIITDCKGIFKLDSYPGALGQVLTNLLLNAKRHAFEPEQSGIINIKAKSIDEFLEIEISDNGAGISNEILPKVFDPFFTTKRNAGGTGLGLNIVYNLVTQTLGGEVRLLSELGKGTQFLIRIPKQLKHISEIKNA